jgi:hypothetical protein
MKMKKRLLLLFAVAVLLCCAQGTLAQKRGPSTPEERRRAVEMVNFLETKPLEKEARKMREALLYFLVEVPDITVNVCTDALGDLKRFKGDYETELLGQMMYSQAKFIIENPGRVSDQEAAYLAGVEGVLRTWAAIKAAKPKAKFPALDELAEKQRAGTLAEHVKANTGKCRKS